MKLSVAWILDHIALKPEMREHFLSPEGVKALVAELGEHTVEIERTTPLRLNSDLFLMAQLVEGTDRLPHRPDGVVGHWYLLVREGTTLRYATLVDCGAEKEGLMPALVHQEDWKQKFETVDYVISIDHAALTHRPDLWGHRGFAREVAAIYKLSLKPEEELVEHRAIRHFKDGVAAGKDIPYTVRIDGMFGKRLAACALSDIEERPSSLFMTCRLARIDARPVSALIDTTNYVMFDLGQPMHAFDGEMLKGGLLEARTARVGERLTLIDGTELELTAHDGVIADDQGPVALAGIMGGVHSRVTAGTKRLLVESAHFQPSMIRATSVRYKKRTEASMRFEKQIDPLGNTTALMRFVRLLADMQVSYTMTGSVISLGELVPEHEIRVSHRFIVERIGMQLREEEVRAILGRLGFGVRVEKDTYIITVPSYRSDMKIAEDIVEEVARMIGYKQIAAELPRRPTKPFDYRQVRTVRSIKEHLAFGLGAHEVSNYAFYDEQWLAKLKLGHQDMVSVRNPVSEHWQRLVSSLVPHLLKNVQDNSRYEKIRLFEMNHVFRVEHGVIDERKQLALLFFSYKKSFDFYEGKVALQSLFDLLGMLVVWQRASGPLASWYMAEQTAELMLAGKRIGYAGIASPRIMHEVAEGQAFIAELDGSALLDYQKSLVQYEPTSKYQSVALDMSMFVPEAVTVDELQRALAQVDGRIIAIELRDFGMQQDKRSITMRFTMVDQHKTLSKEEIDEVWEGAKKAVAALGAEVR